MPTLGFTGTRNLTEVDEKSLNEYLDSVRMDLWLSHFDIFVTGACIGWDAFVGKFLRLKYPTKKHVVLVPWDKSRVDYWWHKFDIGTVGIIEMPEGSDYKRRNEGIVGMSTHLFYCADYPEEHGKSRRSGTWQTVRIGRRTLGNAHVSGIILHNEE